MKTYEIRVGDGNMGTSPVCTIKARDLENAVNIVRRNVTNSLKPYWRRQLEECGDDMNYCLFINPRRGEDFCPYVCDIILLED